MKVYIKAFLILSLLLSVAKACSTGCLRCNPGTSQCSICNFYNNYVPDGEGGCMIQNTRGCVNLGADGTCFTCRDRTYYEPTSNECRSPSDIIDNCRRYLNASTCSICDAGYYLQDNECFEVEEENIENCRVYESLTTCIECENGFIPSFDKTSCIRTDQRNCGFYRNYSCNRCDITKTINTRNAFILKLIDEINHNDRKSVASRLAYNRANQLVTSNCLRTTVENCRIFKAFNKCDTCEDKHFLTEDEKCQAYIINNIPGCVEFESEEVCLYCINGFYVSDSICVKSTIVANCDQYSPTEDKCIACEFDYFLSEGDCLERVDKVDNCATYVVDQELCSECEEGYQINETGTECILLPDNCIEYESVDAETGNVTCAKCGDKHYVAEGVCVMGSVDFCKTYVVNQDTCEKCEENYALDGNTCVEIELEIEHCEVYEIEVPIRCEKCDFKSDKYFKSSICEAYADIANCLAFSNLDTCEECALGYELVENSCNEIPEGENCLKKEQGNCTLCKEEYELHEAECMPIRDQLSANCDLVESESVGTRFNCDGCAAGHIPVSTDQTLCLNPEHHHLNEIPNCQQYHSNNDTMLCRMCEPTHVLSKDATACLESCPSGEVKYMGHLEYDQDDNIVDITFSKCLDLDNLNDISNGCAVASRNLRTKENVCLKCADGYIPIEACVLDNSYFNVADYSASDQGQAFSIVSCDEINDDTILIPTSAAPDTNCKYYYPIENSYYCRQCEFGITGVIEKDDQDNYYLNCGTAVQGCDSDVRFGSGFVDEDWLGDMYGFSLTYEFTCHKCSNANEIPFIHLNDDNGLKSYQLNTEDNIPSNADTLDGEMTVCREPTAAGLMIDEDNFEGFVDNCALGLIVVDLPKEVNDSTKSARCLACKNGFKAKLDENLFYITSCEPIENCDTDTEDGWFEGCKHCSTGFAKGMTAENVIDPNLCEATNAPSNCAIYNTDENVCSICERGYYFDFNKNCIEISIPFCENYVQATQLFYKLDDEINNNSLAYYFGSLGFGCNNCSNNYVSVKAGVDYTVCAEYPELSNETDFENNSYVEHCGMYYLNDGGELRCRRCSENYIINEAHTQCYDIDGFSDCKVVSNDGLVCSECLEDYLLSVGVCYELNIENCMEFNVVNENLICESCKRGYIIVEGACVEGPVSNCAFHNENQECETCDDGYYLFLGHCLSMPQQTFCKNGVLDTTDLPIFNCTECLNGFKLNEDVLPENNTVCIEGPLTPGCIEYNESYVCQLCNEMHYLDNGECIEREHLTEGCETYNINEDECNKCKRGFYKSDKECVEIINTVEFCTQYRDENTCVKCLIGYYLQDNECIFIEEENRIENCKFQDSPEICNECDENFFLRNNECIVKIARNCGGYMTQRFCAYCLPGFSSKVDFIQGGFVRECEKVEISNCLDVNESSGGCNQCETGYYPSGNQQCIEVDEIIPNCKIYQRNQRCRRCEIGYIRSEDNLSCIKSDEVLSQEPDCIDARFTQKLTCNACNFGYYISAGNCVSCPNGVRLIDGCLYCDPINFGKCAICRRNYFMNDAGDCVTNLDAIQGHEQDDEDDEDEGVGILGSFSLLSIVIFILIK